ncbi:MAG: CoA pyrophosphatase [Bacteroidia bacterium]|nr:CoA pyrophosphatase [Bacteroidia bacterium]
MNFVKIINQISLEMQNGLPGEYVQIKMSPSLRNLVFSKDRYSVACNASVLILLYPNNNEPYSVFILRHKYNGPHSEQICLPGGKSNNKEDIIETALRETREELGIETKTIKVIGCLTSLHIPVSNITVFPVVAYLNKRPDFKPNKKEVKELIEIRVEDLLLSKNIKTKILEINEQKITVPYYLAQEFHIWGATAMILSEFLEIFKKLILNG